MARRSKKKSNFTKTKAIAVIAGFIAVYCIVFGILNETGVLTYNDIMVKMGVADKPASDAELSVHFIDVGQGDSTLIICDGEAMLIDAGEVSESDTVVNYLKAQKVTELKYVVATHQHSDHIGGMQAVIENFKINTIIMPKMPEKLVPTSATYENLLKAIKLKNMKITAATDTEYKLGDAVINTYTVKGDYNDLNNYSVIVKITHGDNSFLISGDSEKSEEQEMIDSGFDLSAKILKVGHHGSDTSSSVEFLEEVMPRYAVISVGSGNSYNHPNDYAVSRLKKYASSILRTDLNGTIVFESDREGINIMYNKDDG